MKKGHGYTLKCAAAAGARLHIDSEHVSSTCLCLSVSTRYEILV